MRDFSSYSKLFHSKVSLTLKALESGHLLFQGRLQLRIIAVRGKKLVLHLHAGAQSLPRHHVDDSEPASKEGRKLSRVAELGWW